MPSIQVNFEKLPSEYGLNQTAIYAILQDSTGYMWFGTQDGLYRYNGYEVDVFKHRPGEQNSLSDNFVFTIYQSRHGFIWIGTEHGLNRYDPHTGNFRHFLHNPDNEGTLSHNRVQALLQDRSGFLWVGTAGGLNCYDPTSGKFRRFLHDPGDSSTISNNDIQAILQDSSGRLWVATLHGGLNLFLPERKSFRHFKSDASNAASISSDFLLSLTQDHQGNLWIGSYGGGLNCLQLGELNNMPAEELSPQPIQFRAYKSGGSGSISDNRVRTMQEDHRGNLWIGTFGGGLNKYNKRTDSFVTYRNSPRMSGSLSDDYVRSLYLDRADNLWIGTNTGGLSKLDCKPRKFNHVKIPPNDKMAAGERAENVINAFWEDNSGILWLGTNNGIFRWNRRNGALKHLQFLEDGADPDKEFVFALCGDKESMLWIGSYGGGLKQLDPKRGTFIRYTNQPGDPTSLSSNFVTRILCDSRGRLWIATIHGLNRAIPTSAYRNGLRKYRFTRYIKNPGKLPSAPDNSIWSLHEDRFGSLWIGTHRAGLIKMDPQKETFVSFPYVANDSGSLSHNDVLSIAEDSAGNLWAGTRAGLNRWNPTTQDFSHFDETNGLPNAFINGILPDSSGNLWLGTNHGVVRFRWQKGTGISLEQFDEKDGLQGPGSNPGAFYRNRSGELFIGGSNGFNYFNPDNIRDNPHVPNVVITAFKKFGKKVLLKRDPVEKQEIFLSHKENFFEFEFAALDFTHPEKNRYAYKMDGFDANWIHVGTRRFASYTNLDPGTYIFRVKASNNDGVWNDAGTAVRLVITPPFWQTWWAYLIYSILFITGLWGVRDYELGRQRKKEQARLQREREEARLREARLRAERAEAEKEVEKQQMRTRIAFDLHDEIGSNLSSIVLVSEMLHKKEELAEDVRNYFTRIYQAAHSSTEAIRDIVWFINPTSDSLTDLLVRMKETTRTLLGNTHYEFKTDGLENEQKLNPEVKRNVFLIYKEILANITKHSKARLVQISVRKKGERIILHISDDGTGFDETKIKPGNGLRNIRYRADQLRGNLAVKSFPGSGTEVHLDLKIT